MSTKRLVPASKVLVAATKNLFVPNFVAVTKPFFPYKTKTGGVTFFWLFLNQLLPSDAVRQQKKIF